MIIIYAVDTTAIIRIKIILLTTYYCLLKQVISNINTEDLLVTTAFKLIILNDRVICYFQVPKNYNIIFVTIIIFVKLIFKIKYM